MKKILLAIALILLTAGPLFAQPEGQPPKMKREQLEKLNLTQEQKEALRDLRSATKKEMIDIRAELQKARVDMESMKHSDTRDRASFEKLARKMADLKVREGLLRFDTQEKLLKQLTAEQQEMFKEMRQDGKGKRHKRMNNRSGNHKRCE